MDYGWLLFILGAIQAINANLYSDYEKCRDEENFGHAEGSLVCDPGHTLSNQTIDKLENLLMELQKKIACDCPQGCNRAYTGLLLTTTTKDIKASEASLNEVSKKIFEDAKLGNSNCENGLLIIYTRDNQQLATYRGEKKFAQLDTDKLHKLATKSHHEGDTMALEYLLSSYRSPEEEPLTMERTERADAWPSILGLIVALVLILIILAVLLAFLLARLCPFCRKRNGKKDKYYVNPVPPVKPLEPVFIYTPPLSERSPRQLTTPHNGSDAYGTLGHPSPLSPSTFNPSAMPPVHVARSRNSSRPITPASTHRSRIHPVPNEGLNKLSEQTPPLKPRENTSRAESVSSKQKQGTLPRSKQPSISVDQATKPSPVPPVPPHQSNQQPPKSPRPLHHGASSDSSELPFLDPLRKLEVQTKEDYIY